MTRPLAAVVAALLVVGAAAATPATRAGPSTAKPPASGNASTTIRPAPSTAQPATAPGIGGPQYRLPETVLPMEYTIALTLDAPKEDSVQGVVEIIVVAVRDVSFITLHVDHKWLTVSEATVKEEIDDNRNVTAMEKDEALQTLTLRLSRAVKPGTKYTMELKFDSKLRDDMYGFYRSTYIGKNNTAVRLAATQFEPTHARSAFPCFDEPHYKAHFTLSLTYPTAPNRMALSNTPVEKNTDSEGKTKTKFKATPRMSTYLVAFVVSDFEFAEPKPAPNPAPTSSSPAPTAASTHAPPSPPVVSEYRVYVRPGHAAQAQYAADVGPKSLSKLQDFTNIPYNSMGLGKLHLIAIPDFSAGAMENWGLITYRETNIMFTEGESTEASKESIALVIAHEQAHMWFGDLVSPAWWKYTWLNEGFARYFQYYSMDEVEPKWRLMDSFVVQTLQGALAFDALATSHAMSSDVYTPDQIQSVFDRISYDKGASVLHMVRNVLGDDNFRAAIRKYLSEMQKWTARPHDLFRAFDANPKAADLPSGVTMTAVLETWTQQVGYPVVTISSAANGATAKQVRFLSTEAGKSDGPRWWVPLTYTLEGSTKVERIWLDPTKTSISISKPKDKWIIANVKQTGFYRVNYDAANWAALAKYMQGDGHTTLNVLNRAQVLDDALSLARAGLVAYGPALDTTRYLNLEKDPIPWRAALPHLAFLRQMLVGEDAQEPFKTYVLAQMDNVVTDVGLEEHSSESSDAAKHLRLMFRATLMGQACALGHRQCVDGAKTKFKSLVSNGTSVPPSLRSTVYCTGLREGARSDWDFLWKRYLAAATSPGEKSLILGALGCSRDDAVLKEYLAASLDSTKVRAQDASAVFSAVLAGGDKYDVAFTFFKTNFSQMLSKYGGWSSMQKVVEGLAARVLTAAKLKELEDFLTAHSAELGEAQSAAVRSLETARSNIAWRKGHLSAVSEWVHGGKGKSGAGLAALAPLPAALALALALLPLGR